MDGEFGGGPPAITTQMGEALVARLARLEKQLGLLRRINMILVTVIIGSAALSLLALSASGFFAGGRRTFEGRAVVLRDANGIVRGAWEVAEDGSSVLSLNDRNSIPRIKLSLLDTGEPGLVLADPRGKNRVVLAGQDHGGTLVFADNDNTIRLVLGMAQDEAPTLVFVDALGTTRASLGVSASGDPALTLFENERAAPDTTTER